MPAIADSATKTLAFNKIENPFIGILAGIIGATCYNKFKGTKLPDCDSWSLSEQIGKKTNNDNWARNTGDGD